MSLNFNSKPQAVENKTREQLIQELTEIRNKYDEVSRELSIVRDGVSNESDKKLFALLEQMPIPIQQYNCEGIVTFWNKASERLYGYSAEDAVGKNLIDLIIPPVLHYIFQATLDKCKTMNSSGHFFPSGEFQLQNKDGHLVPVYSTHIAMVRSDCAPVLYCLDIDLSQFKAAEQALRESEERFKAIAEGSRDAIFIADINGRFVYVNEAGCTFTGYNKDELGQMAILELQAPEDSGLYKNFYRIVAGESITNVTNILRKDGVKAPIEFSNTRVSIGGKPYIHMVARDIAERERAEIERENLQRQLIQAQKMEAVGHLAGGVAHDFNNKLSVILGNAELALEVLDPFQPVHDYVAGIQEAARRSAELTRKLLAFARKQTIAPKVIDLNEIVEGMLKMLRRLIGEGIQLSWAPGKDLWSVNMDASQIDQILVNLGVNARDAIGDMGVITIQTGNAVIDLEHCMTHPGLSAGHYVVLAVSDNGCGISPDIREHIFEPFFTTKGAGRGTGLGLATVYGIMKQNQGFIDVASEPGEGTTFTIYFPRHEGQAGHANNKLPRIAITGGKETLLIVEDEEDVLQLIKLILKRQGYQVLTASSPIDAIRLAKSHTGKIDLLITDVIMPGMNGQQLSQKLLPICPELRLLFISGYTANVIAHHGVLDQGVDFIQKPFSIEKVSRKVREVLDRK
jgi:two-component system, cell cycle sensor histidine kinase and response regulator CckA